MVNLECVLGFFHVILYLGNKCVCLCLFLFSHCGMGAGSWDWV